MFLLDTNVISLLDPVRSKQNVNLVGWISQNGDNLFLSAVTLTEIRTGILTLQRKQLLQRADILLVMLSEITARFADRILPMDKVVALKVAELKNYAYPFTNDLADLIIGATADVHGLIVMTRNIRHFSPMGVKVLDPFPQLPAGG